MELAGLIEGVRRLGLAATRSVDAVRDELDAALRGVAPALDSVLIFDEEEGQLVCVAARGARVAYFSGVRIARGDLRTLPAQALAHGRRVTLGENGTCGFHPADAFAVAVPLLRTGGAASVVYAAAPRRLDGDALEAIVALADHGGFAYALAHEREAYLRRAEYDGLTGLLSPRALRERLAAAIERARFAPLARLALVFVDTDRFKEWNDTYGHAGGDALLRALARVLRAAAGGDDLVARNGGDEFCLVFEDTEKSRAVERAGALRAAIETLELSALRPHDAGGLAITASIGVAAFPADATTPNELLERADEAMYHSKRSGRNAVSYFGADGALVALRSSFDAGTRTVDPCVPSTFSFT
ncbi:MAG: GGDEF domain-containing protein [Candidatus Lustribacter sp.]|jgi:diguanylate cyclase (GGDEF)-like protein